MIGAFELVATRTLSRIRTAGWRRRCVGSRLLHAPPRNHDVVGYGRTGALLLMRSGFYALITDGGYSPGLDSDDDVPVDKRALRRFVYIPWQRWARR